MLGTLSCLVDIIFLYLSMLSKYDQYMRKSLFSSIRYHLWRDGVLNTGDIYSNVGLSRICHLFCNTFPLKYLENVETHKISMKLISNVSLKSLNLPLQKLKCRRNKKSGGRFLTPFAKRTHRLDKEGVRSVLRS